MKPNVARALPEIRISVLVCFVSLEIFGELALGHAGAGRLVVVIDVGAVERVFGRHLNVEFVVVGWGTFFIMKKTISIF